MYYLQGAKNHGVVMPDANKEKTLNQVLFHVQVILYIVIMLAVVTLFLCIMDIKCVSTST